ncbi:MAG: epoxide hydrolase family protein [Gammaproteobacteria bacterium]
MNRTPRTEPFTIRIPQAALDDLRGRLARTRWAPDYANDGWEYGVADGYLRELVDYWIHRFDWRAQEAAMNAYPHFRATIDGIPIHFIHVRGKGPAPMPLILSHGWPWTFWDYEAMIRPLADPAAFGGDPRDAFDVIVPSLPGFVFSGPLRTAGIGYRQTAALWVRLMRDVLGYDRFAAQGGDAGAFVTADLGHSHAEHMIGVHLSFPILPGLNVLDIRREDYAEDEVQWFDRRDVAGRNLTHLWVHTLEPQTIAWAMHDSPVGQAAWMLHRRRAWSDCGGDVERRFSKDRLLTSFSLYWLTESFATAIRAYAASRFLEGVPPIHDRRPALPVPTGIAVFPHELVHIPRRIAERHANLVQWTVMPRGGHFAPAEEPELLVEDVRSLFRGLR